jgi:hypothetical protein
MLRKQSEPTEIVSAPRSDVSGFSRYRFFPVLEQDYRDYLDLPYIPTLYDIDTTFLFYVTVKEENRIDKVSQAVYSTTRLWWVIALYNRMDNPFDLPIQAELQIPTLESLYAAGVI